MAFIKRNFYPFEDPRTIKTHQGMLAEERGNKKSALEHYIHAEQPDMARGLAERMADHEFWEVIDDIARNRTYEYKQRFSAEFKLKHGTGYRFSDEDSRAIFRLHVYQCAKDAGLEAKFYERFEKK